jgi:quercetin dioxygenase-like cupin family protein
MDVSRLHGNVKNVEPTTTPNLINTKLYELITQGRHGTDFSFNILKIFEKGTVKTQSHADEHAVFVLVGKCQIQVGEELVTLDKGGYLYIPSNATHSFSNLEQEVVEILILKKRQSSG